MAVPSLPHDRAQLQRVALRLEYGTIAWNVGEAVLTLLLGALASSLALIGFGAVSVVELFASVVVVWHLLPGHDVDHPHRTRTALRLVGTAFAILATALVVVAISDLVTGRHPDESPWGIAYLALAAGVMFGLARFKRRIADRHPCGLGPQRGCGLVVGRPGRRPHSRRGGRQRGQGELGRSFRG